MNFPIEDGPKSAAIEVKTQRDCSGGRGLRAFRHRHERNRAVLVWLGGVSLAAFVRTPPGHWTGPE